MQKVSRFKKLKEIGFKIALPGSLYVIGKYFGVDFPGLNIPESADAMIRLSWLIPAVSASSATLIQDYFEKKLKHLKDKFGILSGSRGQRTK